MRLILLFIASLCAFLAVVLSPVDARPLYSLAIFATILYVLGQDKHVQ